MVNHGDRDYGPWALVTFLLFYAALSPFEFSLLRNYDLLSVPRFSLALVAVNVSPCHPPPPPTFLCPSLSGGQG